MTILQKSEALLKKHQASPAIVMRFLGCTEIISSADGSLSSEKDRLKLAEMIRDFAEILIEEGENHVPPND